MKSSANQKQQPVFYLLGLILIVGFLLRFWNFWNIPFMFDELSAMGRTTYDNFSELIRDGVVERDSHPAGIQVFLYYWVRVFGESEIIVKLPFLLSGLASIWLSYKIGELWFGKTTGILTAAFISSLQLFVMYSQIVRPYVSGLFITLLMVFFWSKYFFYKPKIKYLVWFVIFGALAAYNHYFSLLFAATVGLSGLFLVNRKTVLPYMLSGVAIVILYIPHLEIIFTQAEKGTIGGWLGAPGKYFMLDFFYWLFHQSVFSYGLFLVILLFGILFGKPFGDEVPIKLKKRLILLIWLLPAPIFGYVYSYTVEPILQKSLLIFTTPYFFMLLFSFSGKVGWKKLSVAVILILIVNSLTLIYVRDYYRIFYKQAFEQVVKDAVLLEKAYPDEVFIINDYIPYYSEYYFRKYGKEIPYFSIRNKDLSTGQFDSVVKKIDQNIVILSGLDHNYFQLVKAHFPNWIGFDQGFTFEQFTFSKTKIEGVELLKRRNIAFTDFKTKIGNWTYFAANVFLDTSLNHAVYQMTSQNEWGPKISIALDSISTNGHLIIDIALELLPLDDRNEIVVVTEIMNKSEQLSWRGFNTKEFSFEKGIWQTAFFSLDIQNELNEKMSMKGNSVRIYLWNANKNNFLIKKIEILSRPGNPDRYAL